MKRVIVSVAPVFIVAVLFFVFNAAYTVNETEQVIITQFGKPVGNPILESGLHFKVPFIQEVNRLINGFSIGMDARVKCQRKIKRTLLLIRLAVGGLMMQSSSFCV